MGALIAILALIGAIPTLWQFALLHPLVVDLYTEGGSGPLGLGWGLITCGIGCALVALSGVVAAASPDRSV